MTTQKKNKEIRGALAAAEPVTAAPDDDQIADMQDVPANEDVPAQSSKRHMHVEGVADPVPPGAWRYMGLGDEVGLPPGCPVHCLGKDGDVFFFLDPLGQLRALKASEMGQAGLAALFAPQILFLESAWPRINKEGSIVGWRAEQVRDALMNACAKRGVWRAFGKVRGRGAWREDDGGMILHVGDALMRVGKVMAPGQRAKCVYPASAPMSRPSDGPGPQKSARALLDRLKSWEWRRDIDADLLLGWICAAMIGGYLDWRPMAFLVGDRATGKSTLQDVIKYVMGADGMIKVANTSAAGIYQNIGHDSIPIGIDELEAEADNRKVEAVVKLARLASSGEIMLRGGADNKGVEFQARSCFMFSAINMPPMRPQDRSRMAILELRPFLEGTPAPVFNVADLEEIGSHIRRRLLDLHEQLPERLGLFRDALMAGGHGGRGSDQFGTLLACADLAMNDEPPSADELAEWTEKMQADTLGELEDAESNWSRCLTHLLSNPVDAWFRDKVSTVGRQLQMMNESTGDGDPFRFVNERLAQVGLALVRPDPTVGHTRQLDGVWLAVPTSDAKVQRHFEGTDWAGSAGVSGVWTGALRQAPDECWRSERAYIDGRQRRVTLLALDTILDLE